MTTTTDLPLITAKQCAARLAISTRTLWAITNRKGIPHVRIGKALRYDPRDLETWIEKRKREALK